MFQSELSVRACVFDTDSERRSGLTLMYPHRNRLFNLWFNLLGCTRARLTLLTRWNSSRREKKQKNNSRGNVRRKNWSSYRWKGEGRGERGRRSRRVEGKKSSFLKETTKVLDFKTSPWFVSNWALGNGVHRWQGHWKGAEDSRPPAPVRMSALCLGAPVTHPDFIPDFSPSGICSHPSAWGLPCSAPGKQQ